ncbi:MAG: hypothetical protein ACXIUQ_09845 [Cecembia sp.]
MPKRLKENWYAVSKKGIQFTYPKTDFIDWEKIEKVEIVDDVAVKHPKYTFGIGLLLITSVLILIPIQKFDLPFFTEAQGWTGTVILILFYLLMMGLGIWSIRNALMKRPVLKIHFKKGGYEMILLGKYFGNDDSQDIISTLTKHLGAEKVIFTKQAA